MPWFFLALTAALSQAGNDAISKRFFSDLTAYEMGLIRLLYALPYLLAGLIFVPPHACHKDFPSIPDSSVPCIHPRFCDFNRFFYPE